MIKSIAEAQKLGLKYEIPLEDVVLMALNLSGIKADIYFTRIRFRLLLNSHPEPFYLALCVNTRETPFSYRDSRVFLGDEDIAHVFALEKDTCDNSYFRRGGTALTLNSNSRSSCKGCRFCGTYSQEANDVNRLSTEERLTDRLRQILWEKQLKDFSGLYEVAICTGCFGTEELALQHLLMVNKVLASFGFMGILKYIGSEIASERALSIIQREIRNFALYFTVEVFSRREELLRWNKARLSLEEIKQALRGSLAKDFHTTILYVLGLDPRDVVTRGFMGFASLVNQFPVINLIQNFVAEHETLKDPDARFLEYYLDIRKELEGIFGITGLRPRLWENYKPLWYLSFAGEKLDGIRI